jgi:hypothetical protein
MDSGVDKQYFTQGWMITRPGLILGYYEYTGTAFPEK